MPALRQTEVIRFGRQRMQSIGNPGNQLAIMLIKTTATAPVGLGGLGVCGFSKTGFQSVALVSFHCFHDAIDLTDKTDRTKEG